MKVENKNTLEDLIEDIDDSDLLLLDESEEETSEDTLDEGKKMKAEGECEDDDMEDDDMEDDESEMSDDDMSDEEDEDEDEDELEEAEVNSDEEFMEYAMTVLKKAHGDDFDEEKATETAKGILKKADGDYGAAVGMLTSGLGESVSNKFESKTPINIDLSAVSSLIESEAGLTDEFKAKAALIFEAEVKTQIKTIRESLEEEYSTRLDENVKAIEETLTNQVDEYLTYAVEQWMADNTVAIESSLRTDIAENFMSSLKTLFTESYVEVPESKIDLYAQLEEQKQETENKLSQSIELLSGLIEKVESLSREKIIAEACEDLTLTQVDKLKNLAETIEFTNESDYVEKVETLKEFYFQSNGKQTLTEEFEDESDSEVETIVEGHDETQNVSKEMQQYLKALSAMSKSVTH